MKSMFLVGIICYIVTFSNSFSISKLNSNKSANNKHSMISSLVAANLVSVTSAASIVSSKTSTNIIISFLAKLLEGYSSLLLKYPYTTKILSSAAVGGTGDFIIQVIQNKKKSPSVNNIFKLVDFRRWIVFTTVAGLYIAPALHLWFNYLGYLQFPAQFSKFQIAFVQMLLDQTIGALIINYGFFYAFELSNVIFPPYKPNTNYNFLQLGTQAVKKNLWSAMIANWYCWPIINFLNFLFIPLHFRLLVSNFAAVFWNMYLSTIANAK